MFKNLSLKAIAFYTTIVLTVFFSLCMAMVFIGSSNGLPLLSVGMLSLILFFLVSYFTLKYVLEQYVFRRIKVIYKIIRNTKDSLAGIEEKTDQAAFMLDAVEGDVAEWAKSREDEIETLKTLENYRKRFLGNVSHELKTPIFSIQGYIYTLLDGGLHDDSINERYLKRAARNVERLLTIVKDLDEISKLESGELKLQIQKFDLKEVVKEVFLDMELKAKQAGIALNFKSGADQPFIVEGDRELILRVLDNLLMNSIKYGKEGGGVSKVSFYEMDKLILVEVSDNGIGIEEKHLKHLFDRFYRIEKSRSRESGGSGLGLSIVKHILEAHNQTINVRSTPGKGTTFGFTLEKAK